MDSAVEGATMWGRWSRRPVVLALPAIVTLWLTVWPGLFNPGLWFDEAYGVDYGNLPFGELWFRITHTDAQMAGYYLLMKAWLPFNDSDAWARLPSLIAASVSLILVAVLTKRITASRALPLIAPFAVAAFPDIRWHAVDARGYAIVSCLVLAAIVLSTTPTDGQTVIKIRPLAVGLCLGIALTFSVFVSFVFIPIGIAVLMGQDRLRNLGRLAISAAVALLIFAPFIGSYLNLRPENNWISPVPFTDWVQNLSNSPYLVDRDLVIIALLLVITGLLGYYGGDRIGRGAHAASGQVIVLVGLMGFVPLILLGVLSELKEPAMIPRYQGFSWPFLVIAVLLLAYPWWSAATRWSVLRAVIALGIVMAVSYNQWHPFTQRPLQDEYRAAAQFISENAAPTDLIAPVVVPSALERYGLDIDRPVTAETTRMWVVSYQPTSLENLRATANARGLAITSTDVEETSFGSAAVSLISVRPLPGVGSG